MGNLSVSEAADRLGVHVQRVHQRIMDGSLPAERIGHQWSIDEADLARLDRNPAGRPLSPKSAWALAAVAAVEHRPPQEPAPELPGNHLAGIPSPARSRARARLRNLLHEAGQRRRVKDEEDAVSDLAARLRWLMQSRAGRRAYLASPRDLADLRSDSRIRLSGLSLPSSGMASADVVEAYIDEHDQAGVAVDYLLSKARHAGANVVLHVVGPGVPENWRVDPGASWLLLAADLAEHQRPREVARAVGMLREAAAWRSEEEHQ